MTKCALSVSIYQEEEERGGGKFQGIKRVCKRCGERKEIEYEGGFINLNIPPRFGEGKEYRFLADEKPKDVNSSCYEKRR